MPRKTILYVDDEEDNRLIVSATLEAAGYKVITAPGVPEALKIAFSLFPDLIITDVMMPEESGFSLCEKIRRDPSTKDIPVIFLSMLEEEQLALSVGGTAFLSKPLDSEQLLRTVGGLLNTPTSRMILEKAIEKIRSEDLAGAMADLEKVVREDPGSQSADYAQHYMGQIFQKQGNNEAAMEQYQELLQRNPDFWRAHNRMGLLCEQLKEWGKAARHYQRSLALNPGQPEISGRLAAVEKSMGKL